MLINKNLIILNLDAADKNDAVRKLASFAYLEGKINSQDKFINSVFEREKTCTTGVGNGIAIPHGKSGAVNEALIVFGKLNNPIEWESIDENPVDLIFLLGVPDGGVDNLHLKILAQLSRKLVHEDFVQSLRDSETRDEIFEALSDINTNAVQ